MKFYLKFIFKLYVLKLIYYLNWRIIILQYCGDFCRTLTWMSFNKNKHKTISFNKNKAIYNSTFNAHQVTKNNVTVYVGSI